MSRPFGVAMLAIAAAIGGSSRAIARATEPAAVFRTACAPTGAAATWFLDWVRTTVAGTDQESSRWRSGATLPQANADSVTLVQVDSTCAALGSAYAHLVPDRDTLTPSPVYVVYVAPSVYVVTDFKQRTPASFERLSGDTVEIRTSSRWTDAVTFGTNYTPVRVWKWPYTK